MTHPLTPCEKVELKPCPFCGGDAVAGSNFDNDHYVMCGADCDKCGGMAGYMKTEMAAIENWNRRTALASGSGDHAELAKSLRSSKRERHGIYGRVLVNPDGPSAADALEDLLAENAALREDRDQWRNWYRKASVEINAQDDRATEAERKLAEAVDEERARGQVIINERDKWIVELIRERDEAKAILQDAVSEAVPDAMIFAGHPDARRYSKALDGLRIWTARARAFLNKEAERDRV